MKYGEIIKDYLTFNRTEQRGIFVLLLILFLVVIAESVVPLIVRPGTVDISGFDKDVIAFEKSMRIADSVEALTRKAKSNKYHSFGFKGDSGYWKSPKENFFIELNAADTFELQRLWGIGPSFARRIVKYRERLRGFVDKSQLLEIYGIDTSKFNNISGHLSVNPDSVHPLNLNTVTFKQLLAHPYFTFEVTKGIMLYRKDHKKFGSINELRNIKVISDSIFGRIKDYLKVD